MVLILDLSYLKNHPELSGIAPKSMINEAKSEFFQKLLGKVEFKVPKKEYVEIVLKKAEEIGILDELSQTDIDICALALEYNAKVLTNDFYLQNLCYFLGIPFEGDKMISEAKIFRYRCENCGYVSKRRICPRCGSVTKEFVYKVIKIQKDEEAR